MYTKRHALTVQISVTFVSVETTLTHSLLYLLQEHQKHRHAVGFKRILQLDAQITLEQPRTALFIAESVPWQLHLQCQVLV